MKTRAALMREVPGQWSVEEVELDPPGPTEVLVEMIATGLCHSDDHVPTGDLPVAQLPVVGGHEGSGIVREVGSEVHDFAVGDHVLTSFIPGCGKCRWCAMGMQNLCDNGALILVGTQLDGTCRMHTSDGVDVATMSMLGTFAEWQVYDQVSLVKVPDDVPLEVACLVACGVQTGVGSATTAGDVQTGDVVFIAGLGGVGMNAVQGAALSGAARRTSSASTRSPTSTSGRASSARPRRSHRWPTHWIASISSPTARAPTSASSPRAWSPNELIGAGYGAIRKAGTLVVTGVSAAAEDRPIPGFNALNCAMFQKRIQGALYGMKSPREAMPNLLELNRSGKLKLDELITHVYTLDEINEASQDMRDGKNIRGVIAPPIRRPARVVKEFDTVSDTRAEELLADAHAAFLGWRDTELSERSRLFRRLVTLVQDNAEELARLVTLEMGKPLARSTAEISMVTGILDWFADNGERLLAEQEVPGVPGYGRVFTRREPVGVVLGIEPWTGPMYQAIRAAAPNLMLGNTILLKPSEISARSTLFFDHLFTEAGFPEHVYQTALVSVDQVSEYIADPRIRAVTLTGSDRAGSAVGEQAGRHITPIVLELGGSDAFIDSFVQTFDTQAIGDPFDPAMTLGPLSSQTAADILQEQYQDAVDKGATVLVEGGRVDGPGAFFKPAVITDITPDMRVYSEEAFGPLAMIYRIDNADAAVELANSSAYGLGGTVFAQDANEARRVARRLDTGGVGINGWLGGPTQAPFGGTKRSGVGRELGRGSRPARGACRPAGARAAPPISRRALVGRRSRR